ncbi:hypothetical protein LCGC14_1179100, partial [marine sediment metagenome]
MDDTYIALSLTDVGYAWDLLSELYL